MLYVGESVFCMSISVLYVGEIMFCMSMRVFRMLVRLCFVCR